MDSKDIIKIILVVALLAFFAGADSKNKLVSFLCSRDVCNRDDKPQFCSAAEERCRNCEDFLSRCGTSQMSTNCSSFCCELQKLQTKETLDRTCSPPWKIPNGHVNAPPTINGGHLLGTTLTFVCDEGFDRIGNSNFTCNDGQWRPDSETPSCIQKSTSSQLDRTCSPPWKIPNGHVNAPPTINGGHLSGTTLTFVCDEGFDRIGNSNFTCNDGQWRPDSETPSCIQKSTSSQLAMIMGLVIAIVVLFSAFIISCVVNIYLLKKGKSATYQSSLSNGTVEEKTPIMEDFDKGVHKNESDPSIGNGNGQSVVVIVNNDFPHHPDVPRDTNNKNSTDNTDVKTEVKETGIPADPSNVFTDSSVPSRSHDNKPIQVETPDENKEKGTIALSPRNVQKSVCQESKVDDNRKLALGVDTVDNGDIAHTCFQIDESASS